MSKIQEILENHGCTVLLPSTKESGHLNHSLRSSDKEAMKLLLHWYAYAEAYAALLVCVVVPLFYIAAHRWLRALYGLGRAEEVASAFEIASGPTLAELVTTPASVPTSESTAEASASEGGGGAPAEEQGDAAAPAPEASASDAEAPADADTAAAPSEGEAPPPENDASDETKDASNG